MKKYFIFFFICALFSQDISVDTNVSTDYQVSSEKYFTDSNGNIKMVVNIWGHVNAPGLHEVYDGIDLTTLISIIEKPKLIKNFTNGFA